MGFRLSILFGFFIVVAVAIGVFTSRSADSDRRFEAHEFAVFRSEYEALRVQAPEKRIEHFRDLLDATESSKITPGMTATLAEFCRKVAASEEESPKVQAEARLVLRSLESKMPGRAPASVDSQK